MVRQQESSAHQQCSWRYHCPIVLVWDVANLQHLSCRLGLRCQLAEHFRFEQREVIGNF